MSVCNAAWMIHQPQKLVILNCQKNTTGPAIWQCHGSTKPVAYWRIIPRTGKSPHVQATGKVNRDRLVAHLIHLTWHDMNSFMLSVLNGRSWNNIVLQQLGPGQCKCLSAMPLEWYINLRNLSFWTVKKTPLGQQFDSVMAPLNLWLTGESFHAPGNHLTCKPQAK